MLRRILASLTVAVCAPSVTAHAQANSGRSPAADSVFARASQLVVGGNGAAGRLLVDSMIAATPVDTPEYAEAVYWRAKLAASSADAERDYRLIIVEHPLSPRSGDALFQLAQLELARGERAAATTHLDRFLLEDLQHPERSRAGLVLVRLLFEQNELPRGCSALRRTLADVPASAVEMRNQLEYYSPRCAAVDSRLIGQLPLPPDTSKSAADTSRARRDAPPPAKATAKYTLQIGSFAKRADADAMAKRLKARDLDVRIARIPGTVNPYRVRLGRYDTRAAADSVKQQLKARKIDAWVTDIGPNDK